VTSSACAGPIQQPKRTAAAINDLRIIGELLTKCSYPTEKMFATVHFGWDAMHFRNGTFFIRESNATGRHANLQYA
jgi:hypothetical protein